MTQDKPSSHPTSFDLSIEARDRYDAQRDLSNKAFRSACYAPWLSLLFNTLGDVVVCCRSQSVVLGNVGHDRLDAIWNSSAVRSMRESLAAYRFEGGCEFCGWMIGAGDYQGAIAHLFDDLDVETESPLWPRQMEFALSNVCNFACLQCCGDWSSQIRAHRERMPPLERVYGEAFFEDLVDYLPHLRVAKFSGGEPFLARENYRVWDLLIEGRLRPDCHVLTNGSIWNPRVERVLEELPFSVGVSLDAVSRERLEEIRIGADFDVVMTNLDRLGGYTRRRGTTMVISFSWMPQNWEQLGPMLLYCEERGYELSVIRVVDPPRFSLFALSSQELLAIADRLRARESEFLPRLERLADVWSECLASLYQNAESRQAEGYRRVLEASVEPRSEAVSRVARLHEQGRWRDVIEEGLGVGTKHRDYLHVLLARAHAERRLGLLSDGERSLDEALGLTRRRPQVFLERAWLRWDQGRFAEGFEEARTALSLIETGEDPETESLICHILGHLATAAGFHDQVDGVVARWLAVQPADPGVRIECARLLAAGRRWPESIEHLEWALEATEGQKTLLRLDGLVWMARSKRENGDLESVDGLLREAETIDARNAAAELERGRLSSARGLVRPAVEHALKARSWQGDHTSELAAEITLALSRYLAATGRVEAARRELDALAAGRPQDARARDLLDEIDTSRDQD